MYPSILPSFWRFTFSQSPETNFTSCGSVHLLNKTCGYIVLYRRSHLWSFHISYSYDFQTERSSVSSLFYCNSLTHFIFCCVLSYVSIDAVYIYPLIRLMKDEILSWKSTTQGYEFLPFYIYMVRLWLVWSYDGLKVAFVTFSLWSIVIVRLLSYMCWMGVLYSLVALWSLCFVILVTRFKLLIVNIWNVIVWNVRTLPQWHVWKVSNHSRTDVGTIASGPRLSFTASPPSEIRRDSRQSDFTQLPITGSCTVFSLHTASYSHNPVVHTVDVWASKQMYATLYSSPLPCTGTTGSM